MNIADIFSMGSSAVLFLTVVLLSFLNTRLRRINRDLVDSHRMLSNQVFEQMKQIQLSHSDIRRLQRIIQTFAETGHVPDTNKPTGDGIQP